MSLIPYPNVPNVPGVPSLVRSATVPTGGALLNAAVAYVVEAIFGATVWGIYDENNTEVLVPDSFLGVDFRNNSRVAMHPVEAGGFESYNKVNTPYDCKVKMAVGGDKASRAVFLDTCEGMLKSVELFSVVTPEKIYLNATLQNYSYRRESRSGVTMLTVDLWFLEVRVNPAPEKDEAAEPSGADVESGGQVQAQSPSIEIYNSKTGETVGGVQ